MVIWIMLRATCFSRLSSCIKMADHVAIAASDSEGGCDVFHRGVNLVGRNSFERFDFFVELIGGFALHVGRESAPAPEDPPPELARAGSAR